MTSFTILMNSLAGLVLAAGGPVVPDPGRGIGVGLAAGLAALGAGVGIGKLAASSVESIARQPEATGDIRGAMILTAALIEGVCLFAVVVGILVIFAWQ